MLTRRGLSVWYANGGINIATDIMIAILPLHEIRKLHMRTQQKIAVTIMFSLGWLVCAVSMLRMYTLRLIQRHMDDSTWYSVYSAYWSSIEVNVGILCACLPALRVLLAKALPSFGSKDDSHRLEKDGEKAVLTIGGGRGSDRNTRPSNRDLERREHMNNNGTNAVDPEW